MTVSTDENSADRPYDLPDDPALPYGRGELTAIMPPDLVRRTLAAWHRFPTINAPGTGTGSNMIISSVDGSFVILCSERA